MNKDTIAVRAFANALSFMLNESEGIIVQAENEENIVNKYLVWRSEGKIYIDETKIDKEVGRKFWMHGSIEECITKATLDGGEFEVND